MFPRDAPITAALGLLIVAAVRFSPLFVLGLLIVVAIRFTLLFVLGLRILAAIRFTPLFVSKRRFEQGRIDHAQGVSKRLIGQGQEELNNTGRITKDGPYRFC